jgi:hypothetical protein
MKTGKTRNLAAGTAMIEFVLILPLLAVILSLTFFFGWVSLHKHQVVVANRYAAWQRINTGGWPSQHKLNTAFFADKAVDVVVDTGDPVLDTREELATAAGGQSPRTGQLADTLVTQVYPAGDHARVSAAFTPRQTFWQDYRGHIHSHSAKEGITWRRDEVDNINTLRDQFYSELDNGLQGIRSPGDGMAQMIRGLYLAHW